MVFIEQRSVREAHHRDAVGFVVVISHIPPHCESRHTAAHRGLLDFRRRGVAEEIGAILLECEKAIS